ncbi:MAG: hypothetical protein ICV64_07435 [Thermoleophilia bacterium]|nr:hypothetical protein [Thermoleophilia bacterium]
MADQDTEAPSKETSPDRAAEVADGPGRNDDRNEQVEESPVPDPTTGDTNAEDIPEAD